MMEYIELLAPETQCYAEVCECEEIVSPLFSKMGFKSEKQQRALVEMLELSGAFHSDLFNSYNKDHEKYDFDEVVRFLNQQDGGESIKWLRDETQKHFFARKGERWETETPQWIVDNREKLIDLINDIGICDVHNPSNSSYYVVAILGATKNEMERRAEWVLELLKNNKLITDRIYFLVGERYIVTDDAGLGRDGGKEYLEGVAKQHNIPLEKVTEIEIAKEMGERLFNGLGYSLTDGAVMQVKQVVALPSYQKEGKRPTTESTIRTLMNHFEVNKVTADMLNQDHGLFFVSRSPNTYPQREQIKGVLEKWPEIKFEVGGNECLLSKNGTPNTPHVLHHALMPIAGGIYTIANDLLYSPGHQ